VLVQYRRSSNLQQIECIEIVGVRMQFIEIRYAVLAPVDSLTVDRRRSLAKFPAHATDENVTACRVEAVFGGNAGIGTTEDSSEWVLPHAQGFAFTVEVVPLTGRCPPSAV
jgi:hypothetical protein